jgi:hypothetical protein
VGKRPNIGRLRSRRAVRELAELLGHDDVTVKFDAAVALSDLDDSGRISWEPRDDHERTMVALGHGDWERVGSLGATAVPTLIATFEKLSGDVNPEWLAAQHVDWISKIGSMLAEISDVRAVEPLIRVLELGSFEASVVVTRGNRPDRASGVAASVLGSIEDPRAVEPLLKCVRAGERRRTRKLMRPAKANNGAVLGWGLERPRVYVEALSSIIERGAGALPEETLESVAELKNEVIVEENGFGEWGWSEESVDCSRVVELAELELARRAG